MIAAKSFTLSVFFLGCVLLLHAAAAPTTMGTGTPPTGVAVCRLHLEGLGSRPGFKKAHMSCTGGTVSAAANPLLQAAFGPGSSTGVVWSRNSACEQALKSLDCLLAMCSGPATFVNPIITNLKSPFPGGGNTLCIGPGNWWLVNGTFSHNKGLQPVRISGNGTTAHINNSRFERNNLAEVNLIASAVAIYHGANAVIQSSSFFKNVAGSGTIYADDQAQVDILSDDTLQGLHRTQFIGNRADSYGGDIVADGGSSVRITNVAFRDGFAGGYGGSIFAMAQSSVTLMNTTITNATSKKDGGGISVQTADLKVVNSVIQDCVACPKCPGGGLDASGHATVLLMNSRFTNNSAHHGGAVWMSGEASLTLHNATFTNNRATYGGGITIYRNASLALVGVSHVHQNHAEKYAGGLMIVSPNFTLPVNATTLGSHGALLRATNNTAALDDNVCLTALGIAVVSSNSSLDNFITSLDSDKGLLHAVLNVSGSQGLPASDPITFSVIDSRNITVATDVLRGQTVSGLRHIAVKLKQPPGSYRLEFGILDTEEVPPAKLQLRIVSCPVGYMTASSGDACSMCVRGYFSFNPADRECTMCVPDAVCPGGAELWPAEGFWHSAPQSVQIHRCINPSACLGSAALAAMDASNATAPVGAAYKTSQCSQPYEGNLCADCKPGYGKSGPFQCKKCMGKAAIVVLYLAAALVSMGLIKLLMYFQAASASALRSNLLHPTASELSKLLVLHGQWLFIISNLVGIPWPATLMVPLQIISGLWSSSSGSSIGLDCILPRNTAAPTATAKVVLRLFTPVAILCMILVLGAVLHRIRPATHVGARHQLASLVITVVFLFFPTWLSTAFSLFACIQLDRPASWPYQAEAVGAYWVEDMRQQCYSSMGYHRAWALGLGIPLVLLMCLLLPAGVFVLMWHSRKQEMLTDPDFDRQYGFVYQLWREDVCWWEAVVVLQTIGLVMISTLGFALDSHYQVLLTLAVLGVIVVLLLWVRPFKCRAANTVAVQSACVLLLTAYTALTFLPFNRREAGPVYGNIMGVVLLLLNVLFLVRTGWKLALSLDWSAVREWLASKLEGVFGLKLRGKAAGKSGREGPPAESKDAAAAVAS